MLNFCLKVKVCVAFHRKQTNIIIGSEMSNFQYPLLKMVAIKLDLNDDGFTWIKMIIPSFKILSSTCMYF